MASLTTAVDKFREKTSAEDITLRGRRWKIIDSGGSLKAGERGPALIMLPGTLGNPDVFFKQISKLGKRLRIISLAYPLITDIDLITGDIACLMDRLGIEKASVLGSSYGGFVAQIFAENHPDRVETLFIGNSMTDVDLVRGAFPPAQELLATPPAALRAIISGQMANWAEPEKIFAELKAFLKRELFEYLPPRGPKLRLAAIFLRGKTPKPAIPDSQIVIIDAEDDPLIPAPVRADIRKRYPKAQLCRFKSGGHFPYLTRSAEFNDLLTDRLLS
jgi:maspardin